VNGPVEHASASESPAPPSARNGPARRPLFEAYPRLGERLPHVALGRFPTPVQKLSGVGDRLGLERLYVKRDDLTDPTYGGNKVRKLEFLLGDALRAGAKEVMTVGFAGSNHALATAIHAGRLGLKSASMLMPQANAHYVRRNLLASHRYGAELHHFGNMPLLALGLVVRRLRGLAAGGRLPRFIPAGGSCPLGVAGYVNAAFELKEQVLAGELPEPDLIYVPLGSMGTAVGLALGLKAAGLASRVVAVRVIETRWAPPGQMARLRRATAAFLCALDPSFPRADVAPSDLTVRDDCLGEGYARFTEQGVQATELMIREAGIILNGAYSAKAFAAVLADAARRNLKGKTVLFWNTYNSRDFSAVTAGMDYRQLPPAFHRYFEEDVQPLDRAGLDR